MLAVSWEGDVCTAEGPVLAPLPGPASCGLGAGSSPFLAYYGVTLVTRGFLSDFIEFQSCSRSASAGSDQNVKEMDRLPGGGPQANLMNAAVGGHGATSAPVGQLHPSVQFNHVPEETTK